MFASMDVLFSSLFSAGTDEAAIINLLVARSNAQRQHIRQKFKLMYGKVRDPIIINAFRN